MIQAKVIIVGAGAAGLFCAGILSKHKIPCILIEKNKSPGKKIIISGGGRCNFTNLNITKEDFRTGRPNFAHNILKTYSNTAFIDLVKKHHIKFYEKKLGQLFCNQSSKEILEMLLKEIDSNYVEFIYDEEAKKLTREDGHYNLLTNKKFYSAENIVIASGGLPMPAIGGGDFGIRCAKSLNLKINQTEESLVPIEDKQYVELSGISLPVSIKVKNKYTIIDDLLFTHRGLSGPAILKATLFKDLGDHFSVNFLTDKNIDFSEIGIQKKLISNYLSQFFAQKFVSFMLLKSEVRNIPINELSKKEINRLENNLTNWNVYYQKNEGYRKAEVMKGGVSTDELSRELESIQHKNLYFIGETVDVTGLLGGYNFQWAWSSAYCCAQGIIKKIV